MRPIVLGLSAIGLLSLAAAIEAQSTVNPACPASSTSVLDVRGIGSTVFLRGGKAGVYVYDSCLLELGHTPGDPYGIEVDLLLTRPFEPAMEIDLHLRYQGIPRDVGVSLLRATGPPGFDRIAILPLASDGTFHGSVKVDPLVDYLQAGGFLTVLLEVIFRNPDTENIPCECDLDIDWVDEQD